MSGTVEISKLAELRAKTDRDLVRIIDTATHAEALKLLPKVEDVTERRRLEAKLKRQAAGPTVEIEPTAGAGGLAMRASWG
jgi:hypothetical protein